jgi:protein gp37
VVEGGKKQEQRRKYFAGRVLFNPARLYEILKVKAPKQVFVNEFSDLLHAAVPMEVILEHVRVFKQAHQHQFQVLTKRGNRLRELDEAIRREFGEWPDNLWFGVSVCTPAKIELNRIAALGRTGAKVKWISFEPWLSDAKLPLREACPDLTDVLRENHIRWTVVGGESGSKKESRIMTLEDARYIVAASQAATCKVHFKQLGTRLAQELGVYATAGKGKHRSKGGSMDQIPADLAIREWPPSLAAKPASTSDFTRRFDPNGWKHFLSA